MISHCLNPACRVPFSHSRDGRIFTVDCLLSGSRMPRVSGQVEQYWLCGTCSRSLKVVIEDGRITTVPIELETASLVG